VHKGTLRCIKISYGTDNIASFLMLTNLANSLEVFLGRLAFESFSLAPVSGGGGGGGCTDLCWDGAPVFQEKIELGHLVTALPLDGVQQPGQDVRHPLPVVPAHIEHILATCQQGADHPPPFLYTKRQAGKNHLNEEIIKYIQASCQWPISRKNHRVPTLPLLYT
jgi:hypothetical protein